MCQGELVNGHALIDALVLFPAHLKTGATPPTLRFLIDTGAEGTLINPIDAQKLGIEYQLSIKGTSIPYFGGQALKEGPEMGGIGGGIQTFKVKDVILVLLTALDDKLELHQEYLDWLYVPEGTAGELPNLLGTDVLTRFDISWKSLTSTIDLSRVASPGSYVVSIFRL